VRLFDLCDMISEKKSITVICSCHHILRYEFNVYNSKVIFIHSFLKRSHLLHDREVVEFSDSQYTKSTPLEICNEIVTLMSIPKFLILILPYKTQLELDFEW